jgi:hypothetical protein
MTLARLLAFSLLGASALLACGASSSKSSTGTSSAAGSSAAGTGGGATTSGSGGGAVGGSGGSGSSGAGGDAGLMVDLDGSSDGAACTHLNIGIFGNPGADASSNFQQWLVMSGTSVQRIQTAPGVTVTAATVQPFDVIILDWLTRDYTPAEAAVFAAWVSAGGGVASMSGYDGNTTDDWHANSLLAPLGLAYSGPLLNGPVTQFATHPITAGLTSVTFAGGYAISDLGGTASTRTPIAFLPASTGTGTVPVAYATQMGAGRAFSWGDEWIQFDSQWSTLPEIKQLWVQVFAWISPKDKCALQPPQ